MRDDPLPSRSRVRIRLFHKLLLALVATSLASIVLFGIGAQTYFGRGFVRYLNEIQAQHLEDVAEAAAEHYREHGGWTSLEGRRRAWRAIVRAGAHDGTDGRPPGPPGHPHRRPPHHGPPALYDAEYRLVAGRRPYHEGLVLRPVVVDGETVGWTGAPRLERPAAGRDVRFARRQAEMLGIAAGVSVLLSVVIAVLLARRLSVPIARVSEAARALATGRLETRLDAAGADEIGNLARDFNVLARTLEDNDAARRRWIADVSHELRTPLAIMRGELEAVRDGIRTANDGLVESLTQEVDRLSTLVDDLYQLARADVGALNYTFTACALDALVTGTLERFDPRLEASGLTVERDVETGIDVQGDGQRLAQLLENLLENCARYVAAPGTVRVALSRTGGGAEIVVEDSGPAPDLDDLNVLFEPLARAESSRSRAQGGAGLGLALCRRIALAHGGAIEAERTDSGGFRVRVTLPTEERA